MWNFVSLYSGRKFKLEQLLFMQLALVGTKVEVTNQDMEELGPVRLPNR